MNLFLIHPAPSHNLLHFPSKFKHKTLTLTPNPITKPISISAHSIPARDRVIDFGKHKGKMLGTLPSNYLKWVSRTLRARDFQDWAELADQVLADPVYKDRIEWEFADKVLNGDVSRSESGVADLVEISERFGWDNEDKAGWSRVDFGLLGTSKGGRIPRVSEIGGGGGGERGGVRLKREKFGGCGGGVGRREERRERVRMKRSGGRGIKGEARVGNEGEDGMIDGDRTVENRGPFPGREALLKKVLSRRSLYNR